MLASSQSGYHLFSSFESSNINIKLCNKILNYVINKIVLSTCIMKCYKILDNKCSLWRLLFWQIRGTVSLVEEKGYKYMRNFNDLFAIWLSTLCWAFLRRLPVSEETTIKVATSLALMELILYCGKQAGNSKGMKSLQMVMDATKEMNKVLGRE